MINLKLRHWFFFDNRYCKIFFETLQSDLKKWDQTFLEMKGVETEGYVSFLLQHLSESWLELRYRYLQAFLPKNDQII